MNPENDIVCNLIETPFHRWADKDKKDLLLFNRPTPTLSISVRKEVKSSGKMYKLHFKTSWYVEYPWLCGSNALQRLYCWPCLLFAEKINVWNNVGFGDFCNITRGLNKHSDSGRHLKCALQLKKMEKNLNSTNEPVEESYKLHLKNFNESVRLNRLFMEIVIKAVLYLCKQELPFCSHVENISLTNTGNFGELLNTSLTVSSTEIRSQYERIKNVFYNESQKVQTELMETISGYITLNIFNEIQDCQFFSVEVHDVTDITRNSQCSVVARYLTSGGNLVERFLGFYDRSDRTADALFQLLNAILDPLHYKSKLISQCYDGASVLPDQLDDLQKRMKDVASHAIFVPCLCHSLNVMLQQSLNEISSCRIFFAIISEIPACLHRSSKSNSVIAKRIHEATITTPLPNTRILDVIVDSWDDLKILLQEIIHDPSSDAMSIHQCRNVLNDMNDFEFTFLLLVFQNVFKVTDVLSDVLREKCLDNDYCLSEIQRVRNLVISKRQEEVYTHTFCKASQMSPIIEAEQLGNSTVDKPFTKYRTLLYDIIDTIVMQMDVRYQDVHKLEFLCLTDTAKFSEFSRQFPAPTIDKLVSCYPGIFKNSQRLKNELELLYQDEKYHDIDALSLVELLRGLNLHKDIFKEVYKLFSLVLTLSSTSVPVENASCLTVIRSYLKNTTPQQRSSPLANIAIHREFLSELERTNPFFEDIIDRYAALQDRKIDLTFKT